MADKHKRGYPAKARDKIKATQIITRLHECILDGKVLDAQEIAAARILLSKVLPDMRATEVTGEVEQRVTVDEEKLAKAIASVKKRLSAAH